MRRTFQLLTFCNLILAGSALAQPGPCSDSVILSWTAFREALHTARPSSELYLPYPYPRTDKQVIADFEYGYLHTYGDDDPKSIPDFVAAVLNGIRERRFSYDVVRVDNWTPNRCRNYRENLWYNVVRVKSNELGKYIAYAALQQSGFLGITDVMVPGPGTTPDQIALFQERWPALDAVTDHVKRNYGRQPVGARYVSVWGESDLDCDPANPCVAMSDDGELLLRTPPRPWFKPGQSPPVFEVHGGAPDFSNAQMANPSERAQAEGRRDRDRQRLVTIGQEGWFIANKLQNSQASPK